MTFFVIIYYQIILLLMSFINWFHQSISLFHSFYLSSIFFLQINQLLKFFCFRFIVFIFLIFISFVFFFFNHSLFCFLLSSFFTVYSVWIDWNFFILHFLTICFSFTRVKSQFSRILQSFYFLTIWSFKPKINLLIKSKKLSMIELKNKTMWKRNFKKSWKYWIWRRYILKN